MKRLNLAILIWCLVTAVCLLAPRLTPSPAQHIPDLVSNAGHFVLFLVMVVLVGLRLYEIRSSRPIALAIALAFSYGLALEVAQIAVHGRHFEALDLVMNGAGCVVGGAILLRIRR